MLNFEQTMQSGGNKEELFFDSLDVLRTSVDSASSEDSMNVSSRPLDCEFGYDIWRKEPRSVQERRNSFIQGMELGELVSPSWDFSEEVERMIASVDSQNFIEPERTAENSRAVSTSRPSLSNRREEDSSFGRIRYPVDVSQQKDVFTNAATDSGLNKQRIDGRLNKQKTIRASDARLNKQGIDAGLNKQRKIQVTDARLNKRGTDARLKKQRTIPVNDAQLKKWGTDAGLNKQRTIRVTDAGTNEWRTCARLDKHRSIQQFEKLHCLSHSVEDCMCRKLSSKEESSGKAPDNRKKNSVDWWKRFIKRGKEVTLKGNFPLMGHDISKEHRIRVRNHKKCCLEISALYMGQEIQAHKGLIWTMKFSPDGQYLASGGEDGIVRIWRVVEPGVSCKCLQAEKYSKFGRKGSPPPSIVIPSKVFEIEEVPLHEFHGHTNDVLDLAWSKSNCLLSSSEDKTVRLWQIGCNKCLKVFQHNDYVTCVQFNPVDDRYFISGSIDGKIRIWGVSENRVVDWANVHDIVTAVCYRPDGQGCIVGSIQGNCRFYDASGNHLQLDAQLCIQGKKKSTGKRITGFQFYPEDSHRLMITSADSKVRILDGFDVTLKYRGFRKSGNQMSASFTSDGKRIISVGEDSRVYIWNYEGQNFPSSKQAKSIRSCEHFFSEGASVAVPWSGMDSEQKHFYEGSINHSNQQMWHVEATTPWPKDTDRFSLGNWFFADGLSRASATWPEEKLPFWAIPVAEDDHHCQHRHTSLSATWGLVIVTAGWDGVIRCFHNYGSPNRI